MSKIQAAQAIFGGGADKKHEQASGANAHPPTTGSASDDAEHLRKELEQKVGQIISRFPKHSKSQNTDVHLLRRTSSWLSSAIA